MAMTMAKKILARAADRTKVSAGAFVTAQMDAIMGHAMPGQLIVAAGGILQMLKVEVQARA